MNIFTFNIIVETEILLQENVGKLDKNLKIEYPRTIIQKYVNSRRKVNTGISNLKRDDGTVAETDTEKADDLNFFFKSVFVKENVSNISNFHDRSGGILVDNIIINEEIVKKLIEKLNINKSYGPDLLHPRVLKELRESITTPLTLIFKSSF